MLCHSSFLFLFLLQSTDTLPFLNTICTLRLLAQSPKKGFSNIHVHISYLFSNVIKIELFSSTLQVELMLSWNVSWFFLHLIHLFFYCPIHSQAVHLFGPVSLSNSHSNVPRYIQTFQVKSENLLYKWGLLSDIGMLSVFRGLCP